MPVHLRASLRVAALNTQPGIRVRINGSIIIIHHCMKTGPARVVLTLMMNENIKDALNPLTESTYM